MTVSIHPLDDIQIDPWIAAMPKVDLHVHQESAARLERIIAIREGRKLPDASGAVRALLDEPPGMPRLARMYRPRPDLDALAADPEHFIAYVVDLLEEEAADGAILVEIRFGRDTVLRPDFMALFREGERRVQARYPRLRAEAICTLMTSDDHEQGERRLAACVRAAGEGLAGVDFLSTPYNTEADWTHARRWAEQAIDAGLGITAHAGEFSAANLMSVLRLPGLSRVGHAVHAARDPWLLEHLAQSGATVECALTCNVVLGATPSYAEHPIRQFVALGIPVTLNTDDPVRVGTTIGREYAIAGVLGFSRVELLDFTRNAVRASFTTPERKAALLSEVPMLERG